jgi:hypothetical protein
LLDIHCLDSFTHVDSPRLFPTQFPLGLGCSTNPHNLQENLESLISLLQKIQLTVSRYSSPLCRSPPCHILPTVVLGECCRSQRAPSKDCEVQIVKIKNFQCCQTHQLLASEQLLGCNGCQASQHVPMSVNHNSLQHTHTSSSPGLQALQRVDLDRLNNFCQVRPPQDLPKSVSIICIPIQSHYKLARAKRQGILLSRSNCQINHSSRLNARSVTPLL